MSNKMTPGQSPPSRATPAFTMGVEEELQIIDPRTRQLVPAASAILHEAATPTGKVTHELRLSQVETVSGIAATLQDVRNELVKLRLALHTAARHEGLEIAASGTHPFSPWKSQPFTPDRRYDRMQDEFGVLASEQVLFGCHVHVDVGGKQAAAETLNYLLPWAPTILALSANSPFWLGDDTGFASYRAILFERWPSAGLMGPFASWEDYYNTLKATIELGGCFDEGSVYWDLRVSSRHETLEVRVSDVATRLEDTVLIAALVQASVRRCFDKAQRCEAPVTLPQGALRIARWRAARFGLDGPLSDLDKGCLAPAAEVVEKLLRFVRPVLEDTGDWHEVEDHVRRILKDGTGAARQRGIVARGGTMKDVVDALVEQTSAELGGGA